MFSSHFGNATSQSAPDDVLISRLLEDAKTAWSYFQIEGNAPSMVPCAAWFEGEATIGQLPELTMWDVGSIVLAYVSARDLGLIDDAELKVRGGDVVNYLGKTRFTFDGNALPNFRNSSLDGSPVEEGFDSTDMGRLLIALSVLDRATRGTLDIKDLVTAWDVSGSIKNGAMQDIKHGEASPAKSYVYAAYVSRGYDLWAIEHKPVLALPVGTAAARRRFLNRVQEVGLIATEPSLNEAVELGISPQGEVLAETLSVAQERRYESDGILTAVSEGPMDREPWFSYQAYKLDGRDGEWRVDALDENPNWQTKEFIEGARMVSSKAAFLWLAYKPNDYSRRLYEHISQGAKSDRLGFCSGIYEKSGERCEEYDVNTNAIILEAIAYIKNGRKPIAAV